MGLVARASAWACLSSAFAMSAARQGAINRSAPSATFSKKFPVYQTYKNSRSWCLGACLCCSRAMASAVPPPVGLSSPANMVAYPPADSLISVRGAASSALRCGLSCVVTRVPNRSLRRLPQSQSQVIDCLRRPAPPRSSHVGFVPTVVKGQVATFTATPGSLEDGSGKGPRKGGDSSESFSISDLERELRHVSDIGSEAQASSGREGEGEGDGEVAAPAPGVAEEYDEREMALQSMLYPSMLPSVEEMLDQTHVPVIKDPWQNRGKFFRCRGKKQGKGALEGSCEIFNVKELHINNTPLLKSFLNEAAAILPRHRTGLCAKCQRKVAKHIKWSRQAGLLPTVDDFEVRDTGPGGLRAWAVGGQDRESPEQRAARLRPKAKRFGSLA